VRVLGPLEVTQEGRVVQLGGGRQRALLTILVLHRGEALATDVLIDMLWADAPPPGAAKTLQVYISRLRSVLGDGLIVTRGPGYSLELEPGAVDIDRFVSTFERGRELLAQDDPKRAAESLRDALAVWRGVPLADVSSERFAQAEISRLEELRIACLEERVDADLALGLDRELVAELTALVHAHPRRERLRGQLMRSLYRCGRQEDALELYRTTRNAMIEETGLEPGPELQALERAILNHDPELGGGARPARRRTRRRPGLALMIAAALLVAAAAGATVELLGGRSRATLSDVPPDSLAMIDPGTDSVVAELPVGSGPAAVAIGSGSVWVANAGDQTLARVDPAAKQVVDRIGVSQHPTELAFGQGALWTASAIGYRGVVSRVDPGSRLVVANHTVRVGAGAGDDLFASPTPSAIAVNSNGVFTNDLHSRVWRLSRSGRASTFSLGGSQSVDGVALGQGSLWVASSTDDQVLRINPQTDQVIAAIPIASVAGSRLASPYGIAVGAGAVWVTDAVDGAVSRIDPKLNAVTATIGVGRRPTRIAIGEGAVWVVNAGDGTVSRIDPHRNAVAATIRIGGELTGIAAGDGGVWVTVAGGPPHETGSRKAEPLVPLTGPRCSPLDQGGGGADLLIASDLPTNSPESTPDPAIADTRAAIRLVLAKHAFRAGRYQIGYQSCDDSRPAEGADPDLCATNARAYALDASLVGVIGGYNSFCAGIELPILNPARGGPVAMISPSATYVGLTHAGPATAADEPDRYFPIGARSFARLLGADDHQGAGIDLFLHQTGHRYIYLLDDGQGTGYAGAAYVRAAATNVGLTVSGSATWSPSAPNYRGLAARIAHSGADSVVLSGCICSNGLRLVTDLRRALGPHTALVGTDNFSATQGFIHANGGFDGLYISSAGLPPTALPLRGRLLLYQLLPGRRLDDIGSTVAYAAQATELLLDAIARSNGTRASISRELLTTTVKDGITGPTAFDSRGDPTLAPIAIYRVDSTAPREAHQSDQGLILDTVVIPSARLVK
jgi:YVTN family beta-propeller protein